MRRRGRKRRAEADFTRALKYDPLLAEAWLNRGLARHAADDLMGAVADYDQAIRFKPQLAVAWLNRGIARLDLGKR
jgi:tetratricopeptide (TPR) repeat protein